MPTIYVGGYHIRTLVDGYEILVTPPTRTRPLLTATTCWASACLRLSVHAGYQGGCSPRSDIRSVERPRTAWICAHHRRNRQFPGRSRPVKASSPISFQGRYFPTEKTTCAGARPYVSHRGAGDVGLTGKLDVEKARYWQQRLGEAARSGMSIREYCRRRRLKESQFLPVAASAPAGPAGRGGIPARRERASSQLRTGERGRRSRGRGDRVGVEWGPAVAYYIWTSTWGCLRSIPPASAAGLRPISGCRAPGEGSLFAGGRSGFVPGARACDVHML